MSDSINLRTQTFKQNLYNLINNSNLPISNVYLTVSLILMELEKTYYGALNTESQKQNYKIDMEGNIEKIQEKVE